MRTTPESGGIMLKTTREQLEKLKALEAQATPGPWVVETVKTQVGLCHKVGGGWPYRKLVPGTREQYACIYEDGGDPRNPGKELHANAQVFAESRNALAALIADASEAHRLRDALGKQVADCLEEVGYLRQSGEITISKYMQARAAELHAILDDKGEELPVYTDPPDHSAGLRCHQCGGKLSPPGGLGGCAACKQVSAAENLKNEEGTRGTSAATPPPDSDVRQALDEALPGWDDHDERVTVAEAIRLIHQDRASIKAAAEKVLAAADPLFAKHANDGWWIRCRAAIDNIEHLTAAPDPAARTATAVWQAEAARLTNSIAIAERTRDAAQAEANRLLEENRELRKDIDSYCTFVEAIRRINIQSLLEDQRRWSAATFGHGYRTAGILAHIRKELAEIEADPHDLEEWIDVILLAIDGFWRHGGWDLAAALWAKRDKNRARKWPPPGPEDQPTEHIKE